MRLHAPRGAGWRLALLPAHPLRPPRPGPRLPSACIPLPTHHPVAPQRDEAINAGFAWFREKGLIPAGGDSSDDDVNYAEAAGVEW